VPGPADDGNGPAAGPADAAGAAEAGYRPLLFSIAYGMDLQAFADRVEIEALRGEFTGGDDARPRPSRVAVHAGRRAQGRPVVDAPAGTAWRRRKSATPISRNTCRSTGRMPRRDSS
jgi:hypothetical protein